MSSPKPVPVYKSLGCCKSCYQAKGRKCVCKCKGRGHGLGRKKQQGTSEEEERKLNLDEIIRENKQYTLQEIFG